MSALADAYAHCEAILREADRDRWLAALFAPAELRPDLHALGAFSAAISHISELVREPLAGELRLTWWLEALSGERAGEAAGNPVCTGFAETLRRRSIPWTWIERRLMQERDSLYQAGGERVTEFAYSVAAFILNGGEDTAATECANLAGDAETALHHAVGEPGKTLAGAASFDDALDLLDAASREAHHLAASLWPAFAGLAALQLDAIRGGKGKPPTAPWRRQFAIWRWMHRRVRRA